jgi:hypothetical protein
MRYDRHATRILSQPGLHAYNLLRSMGRKFRIDARELNIEFGPEVRGWRVLSRCRSAVCEKLAWDER